MFVFVKFGYLQKIHATIAQGPLITDGRNSNDM